MTTSQVLRASLETVPISTIFPSAIRMESPFVMGFLHSPLTIVPRLTIAVFMASSVSNQPVFSLNVLELESTYARIPPPGFTQTNDNSHRVRQWRIVERDGHAVVMGAHI